jgi:hypothetical protein
MTIEAENVRAVKLAKLTSEEIVVQSEEVADGVFVFRREAKVTTSSSAWKRDRTSIAVDQGLVNYDSLKKLRDGAEASAVPRLKNTYIATKEQLEVFRTRPWSMAIHETRLVDAGIDCFDTFQAGDWGQGYLEPARCAGRAAADGPVL